MARDGKNHGAGQDGAHDDALTQYVISIPIGQLAAVRELSDETRRSVQSLLREGVEMLLARHTRPPKKRPRGKRADVAG